MGLTSQLNTADNSGHQACSCTLTEGPT